MSNWLETTSLEGKYVSLCPLQVSHRDALLTAASDGRLWELWYTSVPDSSQIDEYLTKALQQQSKGTTLPFVVIDNNSGDVVGSTRFCNAEYQHKRLEIGYTWYAKRFQRTAMNTECKLLLLYHAFECLLANAVELRTHWHNHASRAAIERLGAKQDGVLRNHQIDQEGLLRDTVVFSIIASEWPTVKHALRHKMSQYEAKQDARTRPSHL